MILYLVARRARHVAAVNIDLCFKSRTPGDLLKESFRSLGMAVFETGVGWWGSDRRLPFCAIQGLEHVRQSLAGGKGVILCTAHFMTWELAGRYLARQVHVDAVYLRQKHPVLDFVSSRARRRHYRTLLPAGDFRAIVKSLKENRLVWYTADIDPGRRRKGIFVPFFGVSAYTTTALARLARLSGAKVVPGFPYRRQDGTGYDLMIGAPIENFPGGDLMSDTARVNQVIERAIRIAPEQYLWQYKRFKSRPAGTMRVYKK